LRSYLIIAQVLRPAKRFQNRIVHRLFENCACATIGQQNARVTMFIVAALFNNRAGVATGKEIPESHCS
jgi:hypothetical protein